MLENDISYAQLTGWTQIKVRCHICQSLLVANDSTDIKCPSCDLHASASISPSKNDVTAGHDTLLLNSHLTTPVQSSPIRRVEFADESNMNLISNSESTQKRRSTSKSPLSSESKADLQTVTMRLNEKMRDGWTMLKTTCPSTVCNGTPLIRSPGGAVTICVYCDGTNASYKNKNTNTNTNTPTSTPNNTSPYSDDDLNSRISRKIRLGWTLIDQVCIEPECIGNVPLMKDLNGQIRCVQCYYFIKVPTPVSSSSPSKRSSSPTTMRSSSHTSTAITAEEERLKRTEAIKRAGDMLLSGWKLLSASCPICFSALLSKNSLMRCPSCDLPVMSEGSAAAAATITTPTKSTSVMSAIAAESSSSYENISASNSSTRFEYIAESKSTYYESLEEEKKKYDVRNANMTLVSKKIGEKLLTGWTMLSTSCPQTGCQGTPLMDSPEGDVKMLCVACDQTYEYDRYGALNTMDKNKSYEGAAAAAAAKTVVVTSAVPPPTPSLEMSISADTGGASSYDSKYFLNMNNAPLLPPYRDNNNSYSSSVDSYGLGDSTYVANSTSTFSLSSSSSMMNQSHQYSVTRSDEDSSNKLSKKLLLGWAMLDRVCTADGCTGNVPLMRDLTGKVRCVECNFDASVDKSSPVKERTVHPTVSTPFSSPVPVVASPLSSDIISKVSVKVSMGWTVQDNYCIAPECEGNVPLMLDLDGNVRCVQCLNFQTKNALSPALADIYAQKQSRSDHVAAYENPLSAQQQAMYSDDSYYDTSSHPVTPVSKVTFSPVVKTETYSIDSSEYSDSSSHISSHSSLFDVNRSSSSIKVDSGVVSSSSTLLESTNNNNNIIGTPHTPSTDRGTATPPFYTAEKSPQVDDTHDNDNDDVTVDNPTTTPTMGDRTPSVFHTVYTLDRSKAAAAPPPPPPRPIYDELDISKKMYDKMFAGWIMMNKNCSNAACKGTSLMQSTNKQAELVCVCCDTVYKLDENNNIITVYDPTTHSTNTTNTTTGFTNSSSTHHIYDQTSNATLVNSFPASSLEYIPYLPETTTTTTRSSNSSYSDSSSYSYQDILDKYASSNSTTTTTITTTVVSSTYAGSYQEILDKYSPVARNTASSDTSTAADSILNSPSSSSSSSKHLTTPSTPSSSWSHHEALETHLTSSVTPGSPPSNGYQDILDTYLPRSNYRDTREALSVLKAAKGSDGIMSALKLKLKNVCNDLEGCVNVDEALKLTDLMIKLEQAISMLDSNRK